LLLGFAFFEMLMATSALSAPGDRYVTDESAGAIYRFTPAGTRNTFTSGLDHPAGLAFDRTGNLFVAENASGAILRFAPDGTKSTFASGLAHPGGLAFDCSGNLFVTDIICGSDVGCGVIYKFDVSGTRSTFATDTYDMVNLAFDFHGALYATIQSPTNITGGLLAFDSTGSGTLVKSAGGPGLAFNVVHMSCWVMPL
jgi:sugar lactone lactonase YvrE